MPQNLHRADASLGRAWPQREHAGTRAGFSFEISERIKFTMEGAPLQDRPEIDPT